MVGPRSTKKTRTSGYDEEGDSVIDGLIQAAYTRQEKSLAQHREMMSSGSHAFNSFGNAMSRGLDVFGEAVITGMKFWSETSVLESQRHREFMMALMQSNNAPRRVPAVSFQNAPSKVRQASSPLATLASAASPSSVHYASPSIARRLFCRYCGTPYSTASYGEGDMCVRCRKPL